MVFDLLADRRRRDVLACLADRTQAMALADLAADVAVRENEGPVTEIPRAEIQTIRLSLYHHHLPKLAEAGAVEYDPERDRIQVADSADSFERVRSVVGDEER